MNNFTRNITAAFAVLTIALGATTVHAGGEHEITYDIAGLHDSRSTAGDEHEITYDITAFQDPRATAGDEHEITYDITAFQSQMEYFHAREEQRNAIGSSTSGAGGAGKVKF